MKNGLKFIFLLLAILQINAAFAQRETLWMRGVSQNSNGWGESKRHMDFLGYDFEDRLFSTYQPGLGVEEAANVLAGSFGDRDDLLGIAHDYGGLVMRDLQLKDDNISAMVLVGVPNQGSSIIDFSTVVEPNSDGTRAQKLVDAIKDIRGTDRCEDCDLLNAFDSWVNGLYGGRNYLGDAMTNSPTIAYLNENKPTVPYAVMWGSVEDFSITRLLSSRAFVSDGDYYSNCYAEAIKKARQNAKDVFMLATIRNATGLFSSVLNFLSAIAPGTSPGEWIARISSHINSQRQNFVGQIQAVRERDEEFARILRCEFSNQLLAAEWQLAMMETSQLEESQATISFQSDYDACIIECETDIAYGDGPSNMTCEQFCDGLSDDNTMVVTILVPEPNDGLLTRSEQLLEGAEKTYHLEETNHFQESRADVKQVVSDAFEDLFEGGAGDAFRVPRQ